LGVTFAPNITRLESPLPRGMSPKVAVHGPGLKVTDDIGRSEA